MRELIQSDIKYLALNSTCAHILHGYIYYLFSFFSYNTSVHDALARLPKKYEHLHHDCFNDFRLVFKCVQSLAVHSKKTSSLETQNPTSRLPVKVTLLFVIALHTFQYHMALHQYIRQKHKDETLYHDQYHYFCQVAYVLNHVCTEEQEEEQKQEQEQ